MNDRVIPLVAPPKHLVSKRLVDEVDEDEEIVRLLEELAKETPCSQALKRRRTLALRVPLAESSGSRSEEATVQTSIEVAPDVSTDAGGHDSSAVGATSSRDKTLPSGAPAATTSRDIITIEDSDSEADEERALTNDSCNPSPLVVPPPGLEVNGGLQSAVSQQHDSSTLCAQDSSGDEADEPVLLRSLFTAKTVEVITDGQRSFERRQEVFSPPPTQTTISTWLKPKSARPPPPSKTLYPARWPHTVVHVATNYNPRAVQFASVGRIGKCGCRVPCVYKKCNNSKDGVYCTPSCCSFGAKCGNAPKEWPGLTLMRGPLGYSVITMTDIPVGVVVGQYLGKVLIEKKSATKKPNNGYRFQLHDDRDQWRDSLVFIDALKYGTMTRFFNHSCDATTRFHEVGNGDSRTVVLVTTRDIQGGEEMTVDYGADLWFICKCEVCDP